MDWDDFLQEVEDDERSSPAESLDKRDLKLSLQSLSDSISCRDIATVSVTKHLVGETGREVWTVDKVNFAE